MKNIPLWLLLILLLLNLSSCKKDTDQLAALVLANAAADNSGLQLITVDSIVGSLSPTTCVRCYFKIHYELITDTSQIKTVHVLHVLNGNNGESDLPPSYRTHSADMNVYSGDTYSCQFALKTKSGKLSKYSMMTKTVIVP
jgi:hypothetical protein